MATKTQSIIARLDTVGKAKGKAARKPSALEIHSAMSKKELGSEAVKQMTGFDSLAVALQDSLNDYLYSGEDERPFIADDGDDRISILLADGLADMVAQLKSTMQALKHSRVTNQHYAREVWKSTPTPEDVAAEDSDDDDDDD